MAENIYYAKKLHRELAAAKLPVASVSSTGEIIYSRDLTAAEKRTAAGIIEAHDPGQTDQEIERDAYAEAGVSVSYLVFALWKKSMQDDPSEADALQARIAEKLAAIGQ
jgi:hypothetical protein